MDLKQAISLNENKINWRFSISLGIALITTPIVLMLFTFLVGRLIIGTDSGIFSNDFLYILTIDLSRNLILILGLVFILHKSKLPLIISALTISILSCLPDFVIGNSIDFLALNILTNFLLIILFQTFLQRFKNPQNGLIMAYLITILTTKILENILYVIHIYRNFGKETVAYNFENGEAIKKLITDVSSGLLMIVLFTIGLIISNKILIKIKHYS